jgi:hypothetical protein
MADPAQSDLVYAALMVEPFDGAVHISSRERFDDRRINRFASEAAVTGVHDATLLSSLLG